MVMKTTPGAFEESDLTVAVTPEQRAAVQEAIASASPTPAAEEQVKATPAPVADTTNVPAVQAGGAVARPSQKVETVLQEFKNALPAVDFGVLPRLVGAQGALLDSDKRSIGASVDVQLVSWNDEFVVTPGVDDEAAKKDVRYSADGITLSDGSGQTVAEYLEILRVNKGYENAAVKQYVQLVAILKKAEKPTDLIDSMVQISLSPQSRKGFQNYQLQETVGVRLGSRTRDGAENLTIKAEPKTMGKNSFTLLKLSRTPVEAAA